MDIKRLAIQLYPMEIQTSSSRSGFYFPGDVVSGIVSIFNRNININGIYTDLI